MILALGPFNLSRNKKSLEISLYLKQSWLAPNSCFPMVRTIGNPNFEMFGISMCSVFQCVRHSNVFGILMFGIQAPTVYE